MAAIRIIKKYPNRRLYDTEISSYITIEDVRQLIVDGEDFEVRDAKTGDDLTRTVLLQIISEQEQDGEPVLSTQLLSQIIRFYGDSLQGFMGNYLERSMQLFMEQQQQFRSQMGNLLGQTPWTMMNQLTGPQDLGLAGALQGVGAVLGGDQGLELLVLLDRQGLELIGGLLGLQLSRRALALAD